MIEMEKVLCTYYYLTYDGSEKHAIGEKRKSERICRFCGKRMPDVKFRSIGHAISESLGNTMIINNEECDNCNEKLSMIEQEFYNLHALFLSYTNVTGKKNSASKPRKIKEQSANIQIYNTGDIWMFETGDTHEEQLRQIQENAMMSKNVAFKSLPFCPQNIYRSLCKYFIGVVPGEILENFTQTISWINGEIDIEELPPVLAYTIMPVMHPIINIYIRKDDDKFYAPYAVGQLEFADRGYFFAVPLCTDERPVTKDSTQFLNLIELFKFYRPNTEASQMDLSDNTKKTLEMRFEINNAILNETCFLYTKNSEGDFILDDGKSSI